MRLTSEENSAVKYNYINNDAVCLETFYHFYFKTKMETRCARTEVLVWNDTQATANQTTLTSCQRGAPADPTSPCSLFQSAFDQSGNSEAQTLLLTIWGGTVWKDTSFAFTVNSSQTEQLQLTLLTVTSCNCLHFHDDFISRQTRSYLLGG